MPAQSGFASKVGFPGLTGDSDATPVIQFAAADAYTAWGMQQGKVNNGGQNNYTTQVDQGLTWIKGKHEFKMGWDMRRLKTVAHDLAGTNGTYVFARNETANPAATGTTGNSFASFLLGLPDSASAAATPVQDANIRYEYYGFYFQDNWKVNTQADAQPRPALRRFPSTGMRPPWVRSRSPRPTRRPTISRALMSSRAAVPTGSESPVSGPRTYSNLGPRVGFAYQITPKTVLRGGFGIFYEATSNGGCGCTTGANGSFAQVSDGLTAPFQWDGGIPKPAGYQPPPFLSPSIGNGLAVDYMGPTFGKAPRIYNWSFNLQREIAKFLVEVDYAGNRGHSLNSTIDLNQVNPSYLYLGSLLQQQITAPAVVAAGYKKPYANFPDTGTLAQALRPYPAVPQRLLAQQRPGTNLVRRGHLQGAAPFRQLAVHQFLRAVEVARRC